MALFFTLDGADMGASVVRLGSIAGLISEAEEGTTGMSTIPFDDVAGTLSVIGWRKFTVDESSGPVGQRRLFTGYVGVRRYGRSQNNESLITGASRRIECDLVDINAILSFRLFPPSDTNANRGSETDVARLQWLLSTTYLVPTVTDYGFVNTSGGITLDAADYRGQSPMSLVSDCANASGKNYYLYFDETHGGVGIWYDFDYSTNFTCTLTLSNVLSDIDNSTCFMYEPDAELARDPSRVYSGVQVPYSGTGSPEYRTNATTASNFGVSRDTTAPNANAKTAAAADALGDRYLTSIATEYDSLTLTVKLPAAKAPLVRAGMRISVKASHLPDLTSFSYVRILHVEYKQDEMTPDYYNVLLTMAPPGAAAPTPPVTHIGPFGFFLSAAVGHAGGPTEMQFTMNNPGDPTKRAYGYATLGAAGATVVGDEFTVIPGPPNYNFSCTADSTAGNGKGIDGSTLLAGLYPVTVAGLYYNFQSGVPVTFNLYVTYYAAGGLAYTTGAELAIPSVWYAGVSAPVAIAHMTYVQGAGSAGSVAPGGTLFIGSVTMTYNP